MVVRWEGELCCVLLFLCEEAVGLWERGLCCCGVGGSSFSRTLCGSRGRVVQQVDEIIAFGALQN